MSIAEFDIIRRYFNARQTMRGDVILGIGDDAALLSCRPAITLVEASTSVYPDLRQSGDLLAQNLLTTCIEKLRIHHAIPAWLSLSLTLERPDQAWLQSFSKALLVMAQAQEITLIGGDTTRGPAHIMLSLVGRKHPDTNSLEN
jgi:thiamine-monophosphate kinase